MASVAGITATAAESRVSLESTAGALTQTAAGVIATPSLRAVASTGVALATANNNVQTLAGQTTTNGFAFKNAGGFTVGTVEADGTRLHSEGIAAQTLVDLQANTSNIAQTAAGGITGASLRAVAPGGVWLATADDNNVAVIAGQASAGHFAFKDAVGDLEVGTAGSSAGVSANATTGTVDLQVVAGSLTQSQAVTGQALRAQAQNAVTLTLATNDVTKLAGVATTGNFSYRDANAVTVAIVASAQDAPASKTVGISTDVTSATIDLQAGTALGQGLKVGRVPVGLTQAVVTAVQVAPFQFGFALQLLDEVAVPVQPTDKALQSQAMAFGLWGQGGELLARGLDDLAHADTALGQVGRQARAGIGRRQR